MTNSYLSFRIALKNTHHNAKQKTQSLQHHFKNKLMTFYVKSLKGTDIKINNDKEMSYPPTPNKKNVEMKMTLKKYVL